MRLVAVAALLAATVAAWGWWARYEQRALRSLPAVERTRIYARNIESMRVLCGKADVDDAFEGRCREQALFLAEFPECDTDCHALIDPHLPKPSR